MLTISSLNFQSLNDLEKLRWRKFVTSYENKSNNNYYYFIILMLLLLAI